MQIQIGSSWGRLEKLNGQEVPCTLARSPATDISAAMRVYAALLLRLQEPADGGGSQLQAYLLPPTPGAVPSARGTGFKAEPADKCLAVGPLPAVTASYAESDRAAASRALLQVLRMQQGAFRLLPLPPVAHFAAGGAGAASATANGAAGLGGAAAAAAAAGGGGGAGEVAPEHWSVFAAQLICSKEEAKFAIGEDFGRWVPIDQLADVAQVAQVG